MSDGAWEDWEDYDPAEEDWSDDDSFDGSDDDSLDEYVLLQQIAESTARTAANTERILAAQKPAARTWGWRLNNLVWLGVTIAGAVAGAAAGWFFSQLRSPL